MVNRDGVVAAAYESELPRVLGMLAAIWQLTLLLQMLGYLREYREPAVPVLVWLGLVAAAVWLVPRTRAGDLTGREAVFAIAIAITAVSLCGWADRVPGAVGSVEWSVFGTSWLLAVVAVSRPAWEWVSGALAVFGAHFVFSGHVLGTVALSLIIFAAMRSPLAHFASDVWVLTKRSIARIRREPETLADVTFMPVIFIFMFAYVFGHAILLPGSGNYHEYLIGGMLGIRPTVRAQAGIAVCRAAQASGRPRNARSITGPSLLGSMPARSRSISPIRRSSRSGLSSSAVMTHASRPDFSRQRTAQSHAA